MADRVLTNRELGRATLARQLLLERSAMGPVEAVEHLVGLQAQTTQSWYIGLWSRLAAFDPVEFGAGIEARRFVRIASLRSTIHLHTARDARFIRPLVQVVSDRMLRGSWGRFLRGVDLTELALVARPLLSGEPVTPGAVGASLAIRWPDHQPSALANAARVCLPLVQTPPRGVWRKSGVAKHVTLESWLEEPLDGDSSIEVLVVRYLRAFGPASVQDIQAWCGLTRLAEVVDELAPQLEHFRNDEGRELVDLPDAPRPPEDTPAPVRYLYDYDNVLLSFADRRRMNQHDFLDRGWTFDGPQPSCLLVDGTVQATWRIVGKGNGTTLEIRPLEELTSRQRADIESEGARLSDFLAVGGQPGRISFER